jgi:hypothetical protein
MGRLEDEGAEGRDEVIVYDVPQRSPEWMALRCGRLTSTGADDLMATRKDKQEAAGRRNLRVRLSLERITGRSLESAFVSPAMEQGAAREADAGALYEALTGSVLSAVGFVAHDTLLAGCSPDGAVEGLAGLVEIKAPLPSTHWEYLKSGAVPTEYARQILQQMWITGAGWVDFMSFCPDFPASLRAKIVHVERNEAEIDAYELLVRGFLRECDAEVDAIQAMAGAGL